MITIPCTCGERYQSDEANIGRSIRCQCGRVLLIGEVAARIESGSRSAGPNRRRPRGLVVLLMLLLLGGAAYLVHGARSVDAPARVAGHPIPRTVVPPAKAPPVSPATKFDFADLVPPKVPATAAACSGAEPGPRPASGARLMKTRGSGLGRLHVDNRTGQDAVVSLVSRQNRQIAKFYVHSGRQAEIRSLPVGTFYVQFALGEDWRPSVKRFCGAASYQRFDGAVEFDERADAEGTVYSVNSFTLHKVVNGNAPASPIAEAAFWLEE